MSVSRTYLSLPNEYTYIYVARVNELLIIKNRRISSYWLMQARDEMRP